MTSYDEDRLRRYSAVRAASLLPGMWYLPILQVEHVEPAPGRVQHRCVGHCACGWTHIYATRHVDRLLGGRMTRRCPVDRRRYRLVVHSRRRAARRAV